MEEFGFGDKGRAKLKAEISALCKNNAALKDKVTAIGVLKSATKTQLKLMGEACGLHRRMEQLQDEFRQRRDRGRASDSRLGMEHREEGEEELELQEEAEEGAKEGEEEEEEEEEEESDEDSRSHKKPRTEEVLDSSLRLPPSILFPSGSVVSIKDPTGFTLAVETSRGWESTESASSPVD
uniref:Uncharacterized protein n=1 Tax=Chromera velia CCMP2878 TaxID=1169474 RepID=A0A0G4I747_9ALVE|eukprot:Cvel_11578.t1-p1 / transcript=Cvel_11578.t1 / gene=Cvel_11578 / organism=Chromera_velia_CCMP2878 / gene_product=hypothetical protein / transcript_product=hypothetical protein / location=Cvel_scaffold732:19758-22395(+) / protein_length=180 / sequence_SO=supercontig / SO=protein_coding / is_pseudo=false